MKEKYMVSAKGYCGMWHNEYFMDKDSAYEYAKFQEETGAVVVEIFERVSHNDWSEIELFTTTKSMAYKRQVEYLKSLAKKVGAELYENK